MNPRDLPLPPRTPAADAAWGALVAAAAAPYREAGRFAWHFARGKLARDPVFRTLLERGDMRCAAPAAAGLRVVDIGCGQGLFASLLQACDDAARAGRWPVEWAAAPRAASYLGIELMPRDVARAEAALAGLALAPRVVCADMRAAGIPPCDLAIVLDVLHYIDHDAQAALLARVRCALATGGAGGRLLLRVGDAAARRRFAASQWVDRIVARSRGHGLPAAAGRPLADWVALLQGLGFAVQARPMSRGTPFANVLLVADFAGGAHPAGAT